MDLTVIQWQKRLSLLSWQTIFYDKCKISLLKHIYSLKVWLTCVSVQDSGSWCRWTDGQRGQRPMLLCSAGAWPADCWLMQNTNPGVAERGRAGVKGKARLMATEREVGRHYRVGVSQQVDRAVGCGSSTSLLRYISHLALYASTTQCSIQCSSILFQQMVYIQLIHYIIVWVLLLNSRSQGKYTQVVAVASIHFNITKCWGKKSWIT